MGIVSVGRSLLIRTLLLVAFPVLLGAYAATVAAGLGSGADAAHTLSAATAGAAVRIAIATGVATMLMVVATVALVRATIARPLAALAALAEGRASADDDGSTLAVAGRPDDLGKIARAVIALRAQAACAAEKDRTSEPAAADPRVKMLGERLDRFSLDLAANVRRLGSMTKRLADASGQMTDAARHANEGSDQATNASSHAAGDVASVATASEQLLDSIEEISRQVVQSTSVVRAAVQRAVESNDGMGRLSAAAQKVGDVVSLISRIAAQTNLLALNATIEAARAGEAGRGFAVVAQEVKTLATQTAKATQDITGQIAEMQQATDLSVAAIAKIQEKISEVEHISTIIASAVHEQGAATQEIARNVRSAAAGTATMSNHIENVVRSVGETSTSAASVSALARELDDIAGGMTEMIGTFSRTLQTA